MGSRHATTATSAVKSTVVLFAIALTPAGARVAAQANNTNGIAEFIAPIAMSRGQRRTGSSRRASQTNGSSASAPNASRTEASGSAPNSGAATRMNRNDAPQIAASASSSSGV